MNDIRVLPYLLLLPATVFLVAFFLVPFAQVAVDAFTASEGFTLRNFQTIARDWKFGPAMRNTLLLTGLIVPAQLMLALLMANLVTTMARGRDIVLYIFTIPLGISDLAAGLVWLALLEQNVAALFAAVIIAEIWRATAIMLVILVAGMGLIPREYYEAAEVFGAGAWKRFIRITLPLLRPSLQTALILRTILAFEVFAVVMVLAGTNLPILMGETFNWQFALQDRKGAAAYAMIILAISIGFTVFFLWALRDRAEAKT
jgi:multiple sugar transport system permease protein